MSTYVSFAQDQELVCFCMGEPGFPGGNSEFTRYLAENIRIPDDADPYLNSTSVIYVSFMVTDMGEIKEVKIDRGISPSIDHEIVRLISNMPRWEAAWIGCYEYHSTYCRLPIRLTILPETRTKRTSSSKG